MQNVPMTHEDAEIWMGYGIRSLPLVKVYRDADRADASIMSAAQKHPDQPLAMSARSQQCHEPTPAEQESMGVNVYADAHSILG